VSAAIGGLVVAGAVIAFGAGERRQTITYLQPPAAAEAGFSPTNGLTLNDLYQNDAPAVVLVSAKILERFPSPFGSAHAVGTSTGSGFLVDRDGDILTSYHVVQGAARTGGVTVTFEGDAVRPASVIAVLPGQDLAVLRVSPSQLPPVAPLALGDSAAVRVGEPTVSIGNPFGADRTLTDGIVSALQHQLLTTDGQTIDNVIQTDQPLLAGSAGGPLIDPSGRVIGVNSEVDAVVGAGGESERIAFAIPIDVAEALLHRVAHERVIRVAYLGLGPSSAKPSRAGALVADVEPGSPAAQAGIRPGDAILRVDGIPVDSISDVLTVVSTLSPGDRVALTVRQGARLRPLTAVLGGRPATAEQSG